MRLPSPATAELDRERVDRDEVRDGSHAIVDAVRQAFVDEAKEIVEEATLDLAEPTPHRSARGKAGKNGERTGNTASGGAGEPVGDERAQIVSADVATTLEAPKPTVQWRARRTVPSPLLPSRPG